MLVTRSSVTPTTTETTMLGEDGDWLFDCVHRACCLSTSSSSSPPNRMAATSASASSSSSSSSIADDQFAFRDAFDSFFANFGADCKRALLEMQLLSLCPPEDEDAKNAQVNALRAHLRVSSSGVSANDGVGVESAFDGENSDGGLTEWSTVTFFNVGILRRYLRFLRLPSVGKTGEPDPFISKRTLRALEEVGFALAYIVVVVAGGC